MSFASSSPPSDDRAALPDGLEHPQPEWDPVFVHSRREAVIIFCIWLAGLLWAVPYCYLNGYVENVDPEHVATIWGIPSWLFWGIAVPWLVADVLTAWFCFYYMEDDDLGAPHEGADVAEDLAAEHPKSGRDAAGRANR